MGGGPEWNVGTYEAKKAYKRARGVDDFDYSTKTKARPASAWKPNNLLDPKSVAGPTSPFAGKVMRESRDNDDQPETTPVIIGLDVTGSNIAQARIVHASLPNLFGLLLRGGWLTDPQIMIMGIGDAHGDAVPLQVSQFESDNRVDDALDALFLEGAGRGGNHESYELAGYYVAEHTTTDAWVKRRRRGYLVFVGDERLYAKVNRTQIESYIGDKVDEDLSTAEVFARLQEQWNVFFLFHTTASYLPEQVLPASAGDGKALGWESVIGENAIPLRDPAAICDTIAALIGMEEGVVDLDDIQAELAAIGSKNGGIVGKALARRKGAGGGAVAVADAPGGLEVGGAGGVTRL